jgi:DNA-binding HxlR family transcriptional regulator
MGFTHEGAYVCPVETSMEVLGGKWKPRILWKLTRDGTLRYAQIKRDLGAITPKMLTQQLRELERDGLIARKVYPEVPPRVEYSLSDFGKTLRPVLFALADWGTENRDGLMRAIKRQRKIRAAV